MGLFDGMNSEGLEQAEDRLGGFTVYDTDTYDAIVKLAYASKSDGGAKFIHFEFEFPGGKPYREDVYYTTKEGKNYYMAKDKDKKETGKKAQLPGFITVDDICLCASEKDLEHQDVEEKIVKVYDAKEQKEVNKAMPVLVDLLGKPVTLGIRKNLENKSTKVGNAYEPTAETRDTNNIEKVFHTETKMTMPEVRNGVTEPDFFDKWLDKNKGKVADKRTIKDGQAGNAGRPGSRAPGSAPQAGGQKAAGPSLFGKK